MTHYPKG